MTRYSPWVYGPLLGALLAGCGVDSRGRMPSEVRAAETSAALGDTISPPPQASDELEIGVRLYDQKMLAIPAVRSSMRRHVRMYQEGRMSRAQAMARFRAWLELWIADHPNAIDLAARASRPPGFVEVVPGTLTAPFRPRPLRMDVPLQRR